MQITTIGVDLAKKNLQLAMADASYRIVRKERLSKTKFIQLLSNLPRCTVVMEACGTSGFGPAALAPWVMR